MQQTMTNILKKFGRLLFILIVQVATIYTMLFFDNSNPLGFFLLFLPVTVPIAMLLNLFVVNKIQAKFKQQTSVQSKTLFAFGILIGIALICYLVTFLGIDDLNIIMSLYLFLAYPALIIEVIYRLIKDIKVK